ncbi:protein-arginine deiminase family protein [Lentzea sp. NPDC051213]|uniref:protein-arginine deiminase family protein n=1 Tax=Lentzea sp. NPDC051213 TaxID=3364126 RepID=UPI0037A7FAA1
MPRRVAAASGVLALTGVLFSGMPALAAPPGAVLLADTDRSGSVDRADQVGKDRWTPRRGAIFLPNVDDDAKRCKIDPDELQNNNAIEIDEKLVACNDAQDDVVNGPLDVADLAPLRTLPRKGSADGTVSLGSGEGKYARLWVERGGTWTSLGEGGTLTAAELGNGVKLALEGRDVIRDKAVWNGEVTVTLKAGSGRDSVRLRVAPLILQSDLKPPRKVITSIPPVAEIALGYDEFLADLKKAMAAAGLPESSLTAVSEFDSWFQDIFEPTTASMPGPGGKPQVMHVLLRSANVRPGGEDWSGQPYPATLRMGGRVAFSTLRGPDVGVVQQYTLQRDAKIRDGLNATGNFESLPPYRGYELGRPLYGATQEQTPDPTFTRLIGSQYADPVVIDTSWLTVGHADETVHVIPARNARGWTLMVADPRLAIDLVRKAARDGHGGAAFLSPPLGWDGMPRPGSELTIDQALADPVVLENNETAARHMDSQVAVLKKETGLTERDLVRVPVLFKEILREQLASGERLDASGQITPQMKTELLERMTPRDGKAPQRVFLAHSAGIPNGISLGNGVFGAPDPHGPRVGGTDLFKRATEQALAGTPVSLRWIEDWDFAHERQGEVHCVTNALRDPTRADWWTAGSRR